MNKTALRYGFYLNRKENEVKKRNINTHPVENTNPRGLKLSTAVENTILSRVRLSTGVETSNPCGLLFSTGGESTNPRGSVLSCLQRRRFFYRKEESYSFFTTFTAGSELFRPSDILNIKRCAFFVYGNLRNFHCMQRQHSGLHVYVRGAAVYLHTKVSQDLHRQIVHSLTLSFYKPLLFWGLEES